MSSDPKLGAMRSRALIALVGTAAAVVALDAFTKWLVVQRVQLNTQVPDGWPVTIHHIENQGAAFGLFAQLNYVFLGVAAAVSIYILVAGRRFGEGIYPQCVLGLVLGGAIGNGVDRLRQGYVVDFIDLHRWPIFNVADMAIVIGIALAVLTFRTRHTSPIDAQPEATDGAARSGSRPQ